MKTLLKKWSENEFKDDPQLNLIPSLYRELKKEGIDFTDHSVPKKTNTLRNDPNFAASQQEEDDLAKAIELSLKDASSSPKTKAYSSEPVSTTNVSFLFDLLVIIRYFISLYKSLDNEFIVPINVLNTWCYVGTTR